MMQARGDALRRKVSGVGAGGDLGVNLDLRPNDCVRAGSGQRRGRGNSEHDRARDDAIASAHGSASKRSVTAIFNRYIGRPAIEERLSYVELSVLAKQNIDVNNSLRRNAGLSVESIVSDWRRNGWLALAHAGSASSAGHPLDVDGAWTMWRSNKRVRITRIMKVSTCGLSPAISTAAPSLAHRDRRPQIGVRKIKFVGNQQCRPTDRYDFDARSSPASDELISRSENA